jgi:hypothetical protein
MEGDGEVSEGGRECLGVKQENHPIKPGEGHMACTCTESELHHNNHTST